MKTIFSLNRHPSYQYLLSHVDAKFIIVGEWDSSIRPHPDNVTFVEETELDWALEETDVWLSHLITPDFVKLLKEMKRHDQPERVIQIMHGRRDRADHVQNPLLQAIYRGIKFTTVPILRLLRQVYPIDYVFISEFVSDSWHLPGTVVYPGALTDEITSAKHRTDTPVIVGNDIDRPHFRDDILVDLTEEHDITVCGSNDVLDSEFLSWSGLKDTFRSALCYLNLLEPPENSFNLATVEAMAAGCPVVTLSHPRSIFEHDVNAIVCEGASEVDAAIKRLKRDDDYRERLSTASRELAKDIFSMERFTEQWARLLSDKYQPEYR